MVIPMNSETSFLTRLRNVMLGATVGAIVCTLLLVVLACVMVGIRRIPQGALVPLSIASSTVGAIVAGWVSGRLSGHHGLIYGLADGLLLYMILFVCSLILVGGDFSGTALIKLGVMLLFGMLGGIVGVNRRLRY